MCMSSDSCYSILSLLTIQVIAARPPDPYTAGKAKHILRRYAALQNEIVTLLWSLALFQVQVS